MKISIKELIELIIREVILELVKRGITVDDNENASTKSEKVSIKTNIEIDMNDYKTPVLTENSFSLIDSNIVEIIIPAGTIITHGARDIIRKKKLIVTYKNKSN